MLVPDKKLKDIRRVEGIRAAEKEEVHTACVKAVQVMRRDIANVVMNFENLTMQTVPTSISTP